MELVQWTTDRGPAVRPSPLLDLPSPEVLTLAGALDRTAADAVNLAPTED
jgi:hypothetical protein